MALKIHPSWKQHRWQASYKKVQDLIEVAANAGLIEQDAARDAIMILSNNPHRRLDNLAEKVSQLRVTCEAFVSANHALKACVDICEVESEQIQYLVGIMTEHQEENSDE